MNNPNTNCLEGFQCPKCESFGPFKIQMTAVFTLYDDGTDVHDDTVFDDSSYCECEECGDDGIVEDFRKTPATPR